MSVVSDYVKIAKYNAPLGPISCKGNTFGEPNSSDLTLSINYIPNRKFVISRYNAINIIF
jgi:hypothetical protein